MPAVGETIRIGGQLFEVIGVMQEKVQMSNYNRPDKYCVFIPWTTASGLLDTTQVGHRRVARRVGRRSPRKPRSRSASTSPAATATTRPTNAPRTCSARNRRKQITGGIVTGLKVVLTFIGVLTLAIGGVGIMNIMFVNVQERTREIGVRKALGASRHQILLQFLLEGLVTTFAGGVIGIGLSYFLVWLLSPRPFLAELLDDTSRATDIHLVLSLGAGRHLLGHPDGGGAGQRPAAGDQGVEARSDRSAPLRITSHLTI